MEKQDKLARYQALLSKIQGIDLGGGGFWKPPVGRSTIRIMPPVGNMGASFFVETGSHRLGETFYTCPALSSGGQLPCPICETNEGLWQSGLKKAAAKFRASKQFMVNIVVRGKPGQEDQGPVVWQFGVTVLGQLAATISDPDFGDVSDMETGTDVVVTRTGEGMSTKYQISPKRNPSALSANAEQLMIEAKDLADEVTSKLLPYDQLATESGVNVYLTDGVLPDIKEDVEEEPEAVAEEVVEEEIEEEEPEPVKVAPKQVVKPATSASAAIQAKLKARMASGK